MRVSSIIVDEGAVSSTIGVVLMVAVTVVLAAAVGTFALGLAEESAKETPSASIEVAWGVDGGERTVDVTILGGQTLKSEFVTVELAHSVVWNSDQEDDVGGLVYYGGKTWADNQITSGDTLGLKEDSASIDEGEKLTVIWNNGQKSQILGSGTLT